MGAAEFVSFELAQEAIVWVRDLVQALGPFYMRQLRLVCGKDEGEMKNDGCSSRSLEWPACLVWSRINGRVKRGSK